MHVKSTARIIPKYLNVFTLSRLKSNIDTDTEEITGTERNKRNYFHNFIQFLASVFI